MRSTTPPGALAPRPSADAPIPRGVHPVDTPATVASGRRARLLFWVTVLGCCAGALLRIWLYLRDPSQYYDELMLSLNVAMRSYGELLGTLRPEQMAPPAFLWAQRLMVDLFGVGDRALRIVPLLAGIALAPATALLGRRLGGWGVAAVCAWATALSPVLLGYSVAAKQYGLDPLVAVLLVLLALATLREPRRWPWLLLGGCVALLWCIPAPFVLAGAGLALAVDAHARGELRRSIPRLAVIGGAWLLVFAAVYLVSYHDPRTAAYLRRFWGGFFPAGAGSARRLVLLVADGIARPLSIEGPLAIVPIALYWGLCAAGAWHLLRRLGAARVVLLIAPLAAMYA
ncbi:MAG TPA: glycosyltransferase family 39 protein, partial [Longimicrobiaceae bacterium]